MFIILVVGRGGCDTCGRNNNINNNNANDNDDNANNNNIGNDFEMVIDK